MTRARTSIDTPLGRYALAASERGLTHVRPAEPAEAPPRRAGAEPPAATRVLAAAREAFAGYFAGDVDALALLPLDPAGTAFQERVWRALREIPAGATESYGALARRIGRPGAARAVGLANRANPLAIVVPCHRVIGADGRLTGYAGGLERKRWLLAHEAGDGRLPVPPRTAAPCCARPEGRLRQAASPPSSSLSPEAPSRSRARAATSI